MNGNLIKGHIATFSANVLWGLLAPIAKIVLTAGVVTPLMLSGFRMIGAALLFWLLSLFLPREHVCPKDLLLLAGAAMLGIVLNQGSYLFGVSLTAPGEAAVITTTMPIWVMILAWIILREPITLKKAGGIALGASGALLLVMGNLGDSEQTGANPTLGDLLVLAAQLSYALYLTLYRNFIRKYSVVTLMKWMFLFASIVIIPFTTLDYATTDWGAFTWREIAGSFYVVVGATFLSYICVMTGQKVLRPTLVGMYNYVQPIVATIIGISIGLDSFTATKVIAVAMIFSGVFLVNISKAKSSDDTDSDTSSKTESEVD